MHEITIETFGHSTYYTGGRQRWLWGHHVMCSCGWYRRGFIMNKNAAVAAGKVHMDARHPSLTYETLITEYSID